MKVAINGFGRIGRLVLRAFLESAKKYNFEIVAINDLQNLDTAIHLLKYDSIHGRLNGYIQKVSEKEFLLNEKKIMFFSEKAPENLPWRDLEVDLVLESTGAFKNKELCGLHIKAGAQKVLVSCPMDDADKTIIYGVNHNILDVGKDIIVSNASCTTNCLAPVIKAIHEEIVIANGFMTTIHSYTGDQRLVDMNHRDLRRSRGASSNIIPTSTGATDAIEKIFKDLKGKLHGLSVRVPTPNVSMIDFTFTAEKKITENDIFEAIIKHANAELKEVLSYTDEPLVSVDFNHSLYSATVDLSLTKVIDSTLGRVVAWYDNEWGFSNRMLDTAQEMF